MVKHRNKNMKTSKQNDLRIIYVPLTIESMRVYEVKKFKGFVSYLKRRIHRSRQNM